MEWQVWLVEEVVDDFVITDATNKMLKTAATDDNKAYLTTDTDNTYLGNTAWQGLGSTDLTGNNNLSLRAGDNGILLNSTGSVITGGAGDKVFEVDTGKVAISDADSDINVFYSDASGVRIRTSDSDTPVFKGNDNDVEIKDAGGDLVFQSLSAGTGQGVNIKTADGKQILYSDQNDVVLRNAKAEAVFQADAATHLVGVTIKTADNKTVFHSDTTDVEIKDGGGTLVFEADVGSSSEGVTIRSSNNKEVFHSDTDTVKIRDANQGNPVFESHVGSTSAGVTIRDTGNVSGVFHSDTDDVFLRTAGNKVAFHSDNGKIQMETADADRLFFVDDDDMAFIGHNAGESNTGCCNAFYGAEAGRDNTSGKHNTFLGRLAGANNTTGDDSVLIGHNALKDVVGSDSYTAIVIQGSAKSFWRSDWNTRCRAGSSNTGRVMCTPFLSPMHILPAIKKFINPKRLDKEVDENIKIWNEYQASIPLPEERDFFLNIGGYVKGQMDGSTLQVANHEIVPAVSKKYKMNIEEFASINQSLEDIKSIPLYTFQI